MLSGSDPHHPSHLQQHGPPHHHYPGVEHGVVAHSPDATRRPCCNYSTISIPLPHPQPPLPEKRHLPSQSGSPSDGVGTVKSTASNATSNGQHQHHVTFSPTVGEIAPSAGQNGEDPAESEAASKVSVKFVQDSSRFWYKPGISREQGNT